MSAYNQNRLNERVRIIQSQKLFFSFLDSYTINKLIHLYDTKSSIKISNYVESEREKQGLDNLTTIVGCEYYGHNNENSTLYLSIRKNNKDFLHLTIHLSPKTDDPNLNGLIHFFKDVYDVRLPGQKLSKKERSLYKNKLYSLISVSQPQDKPNSLYFSISGGYKTDITDNIYDSDLKKELDVIITVLNNIFDESNPEFYIGDENKLYSIHKDTDPILNNINMRSNLVTLKNKDKRLYLPIAKINPKNYKSVDRTLKSRSSHINNKILNNRPRVSFDALKSEKAPNLNGYVFKNNSQNKRKTFKSKSKTSPNFIK